MGAGQRLVVNTGDGAVRDLSVSLDRAGIPGLCQYFSPHDLRHRYASVKIAEGVPVTTVAAQLGHSKKSLTLDTYTHVLLDR